MKKILLFSTALILTLSICETFTTIDPETANILMNDEVNTNCPNAYKKYQACLQNCTSVENRISHEEVLNKIPTEEGDTAAFGVEPDWEDCTASCWAQYWLDCAATKEGMK